jgi:23S rRNA (guanosine2251-2'-O)-methyltransferase
VTGSGRVESGKTGIIMDKFGTEMTELLPEEEEETVTVREEAESGKQHTRSGMIEGRNAVQEALRAGKTADRLYIQDGLRDPAIGQIVSKVKKQGATVSYVKKQQLDQMSETGRHQGVILLCSAYEYATMEEIFRNAEEKGEAPFVFLLDEIEDPHNLGAIIRTANLCGAHGVIIPKHRAVGLTATVVKASAGAVNYTPVVKVTNIAKTIDDLKKRGMWFACADMGGEVMYNCNLTGSIGLVIGNEGTGVSRLVREKCDYIVSVPMKGNIDSLNASVAAGVLAYEIVRQRMEKQS